MSLYKQSKTQKPTHINFGILVSHPIQYFVPVYRKLAETHNVNLTVLYRSRMGVEQYLDTGFNQIVKWDIPLLDGYKYIFLSDKNNNNGFEMAIFSNILRKRFDVLMVHGYSNITNIVAIVLGRIVGTKILMRGDTRIQAHHKSSTIKTFLKRIVFKFCNGFVSIGTLNREYYAKHGVSASRLFFAPFCVNNNQFIVSPDQRDNFRRDVRGELDLSEDSLIILFASKLIKLKKADELIRAFARLSSEFPKAVLVIAGSGEEEMNLRTLADSLGIAQIRFVGFKNQTELPRLYASSDFFVLPSHLESWGLVVNEVMAAGLPVIVSNQVGAAVDLVEGKDTGIVYSYGDENALFQAMRMLLTQPKLRLIYAKKASELIQSWDVNECASGILNAAKKVTTRR